MYDAGKIITGLILFIGLFTSPIWYNLSSGKALEKPNLVLPDKINQKECVESTEYMITNHMVLLNEWRYKVVREGDRNFTTADGRHYKMSLTNTCLNCHSDKSKFCDQCHNYVGVSAYCWDCHNEPKKLGKQS